MRLARIVSTSLLVLLITVTVIGARYQVRAEGIDRLHVPGRLVPVRNQEFHIFCKGQGSPAVILESGHALDYRVWLPTMDAASKTTKVCSYDRLGLGWSSKNTKPTRSIDVAMNLHELLAEADIELPVILVGWSAGGIYIRKYSELFPDDVAGLMFVDSSHEQQDLSIPEREWQYSDYFSKTGLCAMISWTGVYRKTNYYAQWIPKLLSAENAREHLAILNRTSKCSGLIYENGFQYDVTSDAHPQSVGDRPIVAITRGLLNLDERSPAMAEYYSNIWPKLQAEIASLSTNSVSLIAEDSDHGVPYRQPQLIADAITMMIDAVAARQDLLRELNVPGMPDR